MIKDLENSGRQFELNVSEKLLFEQKNPMLIGKTTGITNRLHHKIILSNKTSDYVGKVS